jgi:predicted nucleotide-binding protein
LARGNVLVCPYLIDLEPADLAGPLSQFQSAKADREGTFSLVRTLNGKNKDLAVSDSVLNRAFEVYWPTLEARLSEIRRTLRTGSVPRSIDERIEEILVLLRQLVEQRVVPEPVGRTPKEATPATTKPRVFIGSSSEGLRVAELIQLGLQQSAECTLWTQGAFALSRTVIESIVDLTVQYDFAVLVLTPDDFLVKRAVEASGPRDNVVFELGLFTGALGRARTFMVFPRAAKLHLPSDLAGVTAVAYEKRSDGNLEAALGPVCTRIKQAMGVF